MNYETLCRTTSWLLLREDDACSCSIQRSKKMRVGISFGNRSKRMFQMQYCEWDRNALLTAPHFRPHAAPANIAVTSIISPYSLKICFSYGRGLRVLSHLAAQSFQPLIVSNYIFFPGGTVPKYNICQFSSSQTITSLARVDRWKETKDCTIVDLV